MNDTRVFETTFVAILARFWDSGYHIPERPSREVQVGHHCNGHLANCIATLRVEVSAFSSYFYGLKLIGLTFQDSFAVRLKCIDFVFMPLFVFPICQNMLRPVCACRGLCEDALSYKNQFRHQ